MIRIIFASDEVERIYRIQEFRFRKILIRVLQLAKGTTDYSMIEKCNEDELAETVYKVMKTRCSTKNGSLSIADVDKTLTSLVDDVDTQFSILYQKCSAMDLKW